VGDQEIEWPSDPQSNLGKAGCKKAATGRWAGRTRSRKRCSTPVKASPELSHERGDQRDQPHESSDAGNAPENAGNCKLLRLGKGPVDSSKKKVEREIRKKAAENMRSNLGNRHVRREARTIRSTMKKVFNWSALRGSMLRSTWRRIRALIVRAPRTAKASQRQLPPNGNHSLQRGRRVRSRQIGAEKATTKGRKETSIKGVCTKQYKEDQWHRASRLTETHERRSPDAQGEYDLRGGSSGQNMGGLAKTRLARQSKTRCKPL